MYCAIDIETTGLDPVRCQILSFGAVLANDRNIEKCPTFYRVLRHDFIRGEPYALQMNNELLGEGPAYGIRPASLFSDFAQWLGLWGLTKVTPVGKNFGSFDLQFLLNLDPQFDGLFSHRSLDVGALYATPSGIPSQSELLKTYKPPFDFKEHNALDDAKCSLQLAYRKLYAQP